MDQKERRRSLIQRLLDEEERYGDIEIPAGEEEQRSLLRGLMNVRPPREISPALLELQDGYLRAETEAKGITDIRDLEPIQPGIYLWQGDITALRCDAIVNAANSGLTGCYVPNHTCIDNCIHTYAGMQLRLACDRIIRAQGHEEPTGCAKITPGYDLPCRYVLHTVGPIINGPLTEEDCEALASCYRSCLELAAQNDVHSIAFCCISTGVFHFPADRAAQIAVATVKDYLERTHEEMEVIFNVHSTKNRDIYARLLQ